MFHIENWKLVNIKHRDTESETQSQHFILVVNLVTLIPLWHPLDSELFWSLPNIYHTLRVWWGLTRVLLLTGPCKQTVLLSVYSCRTSLCCDQGDWLRTERRVLSSLGCPGQLRTRQDTEQPGVTLWKYSQHNHSIYFTHSFLWRFSTISRRHCIQQNSIERENWTKVHYTVLQWEF